MPQNYAAPTTQSDTWMDFWKGLTPAYGKKPTWNMYMNSMRSAPQAVQDNFRDTIEDNPSSAYGIYSSFEGQGKGGNYQNWMRNQQGKYWDLYGAHSQGDPTLWWTDFMRDLNPETDFKFANPYERGERPGSHNPSMRMMR